MGGMTNTADTDLVGSEEASLIIGRSRRTLHKMVEDGVIAPALVAPGGPVGTFLFRRADVERVARDLERRETAKIKAHLDKIARMQRRIDDRRQRRGAA